MIPPAFRRRRSCARSAGIADIELGVRAATFEWEKIQRSITDVVNDYFQYVPSNIGFEQVTNNDEVVGSAAPPSFRGDPRCSWRIETIANPRGDIEPVEVADRVPRSSYSR